jgi:hypothetical protein
MSAVERRVFEALGSPGGFVVSVVVEWAAGEPLDVLAPIADDARADPLAPEEPFPVPAVHRHQADAEQVRDFSSGQEQPTWRIRSWIHAGCHGSPSRAVTRQELG